ncbi:MAG: TAXI family TRAP transporter solute-binding subunit [Desulfohalobiaceae bacterium]
MSWKRGLLFLAVVLGLLASAPAAQAAEDILFGGASTTGVYYQVALQISNLMNKHEDDKYNYVGRPTGGSVFNLNAIKRGAFDFGVAQSDRNWQAYEGKAEWEGEPIEDLRSVFSMHPETVLLVTREDTGIETVEDIKGKDINIGNPGSGQRGNAEDVLEVYGIDKDEDIDAEGLQQHEASRALVDKKIDAFFYTVGNPSAAIEEPANSTDINIIPINHQKIKDMVDDSPYYVMTTIPGGTYKGVEEDVETYAVTATVITSAEVGEDTVYDMVKTVFENLDELRGSHAAFENLNPEEMLQGLSAPFHPGAEKYYKEQGWM